MLSYKDAAKMLKKVGCANATGAALAAMYAHMIPFHACLQYEPDGNPTIIALYNYFIKFPDDIIRHSEAKRLLTNPLEVCEIVFGE